MIAFDRSRRAEAQPATQPAVQRVAADDAVGSQRVRQLMQLQRQLNASPDVVAQMQLAEDLNAAQRRRFSSDDALRQKQQEASLRGPSSDPVQRYRAIDAGGFKQNKAARFASQAPERTRYTTRQTVKTSAAADQGIKAALDGTLAIENTDAQPKLFFATQQVVDDGNHRLEAVNSPVRLERSSGRITVPAATGGSKKLGTTGVAPVAGENPLVTKGVQECNMVAEYVVGLSGSSNDLILGGAGDAPESRVSDTSYLRILQKLPVVLGLGGAPDVDSASAQIETTGIGPRDAAPTTANYAKLQALVDTGELEPDALTYYLRRHDLSDQQTNRVIRIVHRKFQAANQGKRGDERKPVSEEGLMQAVAQSYDDLRPSQQQVKSQALGINSYAAPEPGEGIATFTLDTGEKSAYRQAARHSVDDIKTELATGVAPWNWHFASAVAKSEDGQDYVTLENYNRRPEVDAEATRISANLRQDFGAFSQSFDDYLARQIELYRGKIQDPSSLPKAHLESRKIAASQKQLKQAVEAAKASLRALGEKSAMASLWYFRMYGPVDAAEGDQSFHAASLATGDFVAPLTVRLGRNTVADQQPDDGDEAIDELDQDEQDAVVPAQADAGWGFGRALSGIAAAAYSLWPGR